MDVRGHDVRKGDRVRVLLEGPVRSVSTTEGSPVITIGGDRYFATVWADTDYVLTVEKLLPPLPTTPGSVISTGAVTFGPVESGTRYFRFLTDAGWIDETGVLISTVKIEHARRLYEIEYDAGKAKK